MPTSLFLIDRLGEAGSAFPLGKTIRDLTSFIERLESVAQVQKGNSGVLKDARERLTKAFDAAVSKFEVAAEGGAEGLNPGLPQIPSLFNPFESFKRTER